MLLSREIDKQNCVKVISKTYIYEIWCLRLHYVTMILNCHWWKLWSRDTDVSLILSIISIKNYKLLNSNNNRSKPKLVRLLWVIVVSRRVTFGLNMICLKLRFLYQISYIRFGIALTCLFFNNFSRHDHQIELL